MSRKRNRTRYKNQRPTPIPKQEKGTPLTKPQAVAEILSALDGYSNAAAFLGEDSPLIASGTFHRSGLTSQTELLTVSYRENWLVRRIIDMPSDDMTRAWYTLATALPENALHDIYRLEAKHSVKQEITNAIRMARLYGGSLALMVIRGEEDMLDQPLDPDMLLPGCFQGLLVLDRAQGIEPSLELVTDLDDPDFGLPMYYTVNLEWNEGWNRTAQAPGRPASASSAVSCAVRIHHSRVLRFIGRELPRMESVSEDYWGASELEHLWDELQKRSATSANIAQLIFQANITTLKMGDLGSHLAFGDENMRSVLMQTLSNENRLRTSYGLQLISTEDSLENHAYSFSGLSDVYEAFMLDMAGAAEIPATKLFGRSPEGMNATGEADLHNYYDMISQLQERHLRPALERLLPILAISCWGFVPEDMEIVFRPVMTISNTERADLAQKLTADVFKAYEIGLLTADQALAELKIRGESIGLYTKL